MQGIDHYAAGLIDGEGYVGIVYAGGSPQVRLKIVMTDKGKGALEKMQDAYGGKLCFDTPAKGNRREAWGWRLNGRAATDLLERLLPALTVKAEPSRIAIKFQMAVDAAPRHPNGQTVWSDDLHDKAQWFIAAIKEANRRGPDAAAPIGQPFARIGGGTLWALDEDLFGPVEYDGRLPLAGALISGVAYELRTWEPRTVATGFSSSPDDETDQLLPTPRSSDTNGAGRHGTGGADLRTVVAEELMNRPAVAYMFGRFTPAIRRWESVLGREAPPPTVPGDRGGRARLNPAFCEWMMGLPPGWVTDPDIGLTRSQQLKALGNGVVPQQGAAAIADMITNFKTQETTP